MLPFPRRLRYWLPLAAVGFAVGYAVPGSWRAAWIGAPPAREDTTGGKSPPPPAPMAAFASTIQPIFESHCHDCHGDGMKKGGLDLNSLATLTTTNPTGLRDLRTKWKSIRTHVASNLMPPADEDPLPDAAKSTLLAWIDHAIFPVDPRNPDPGQFTVRRLNRAEYSHTIRDLLGVAIDASTLPPDDSGYGFDNIGDVLSLAPAHLERYQEFAFDALARAFEPATPARVRLLPDPNPGESTADHARRVLDHFLARAFRRPVNSDELARYLSFAASSRDTGESPESALRLAMEAALVSPDFLFRGLSVLRASAPAGSIEPVPETDLASRLSYFLWSSMPDDRLLALAEKGQLREQLAAEANRMLDDPKAEALVDRFFLQWLQVLDINVVQPDGRTFRRAFNSDVRRSMLAETRAFCRHLLRENRPAVELLTADYTFADNNLRRLYGLPDSGEPGFQRVDLKGTGRRGILTQGSVLTVTSNPTRTSPVKRGKWVLENILDQPPPPPPPNVPSLESLADIPQDAPLRVKLEAHQANPACASCHKLMDGIGFSFEHFDGIGRWREKDGERPIDPRGTLATGEAFASPEELISLLVSEKRDEFHRAVAAKMLTFALGRGLDYFDEPAVQSIVATASKEDGRMRAFVHAVVQSFPFQNRRLPGPSPIH